MNEEVKALLKQILSMQIECTQILTKVLLEKNQLQENNSTSIEKTKEQNKVFSLKRVRKHNQETHLRNSKINSKQIDHSLLVNQETAQINESSNQKTQERLDLLLEELLEQKPKGKLAAQECYDIINKFIEQFRIIHSKKLKCIDLNFSKIVEEHDAKIFQNVRSVLKQFIQNIDNLKEPKETNSINQLIYYCPSCSFQGIQPVHFAHILKRHCNSYQLFSCFLCFKDFQSHKLLSKHINRYHQDKQRKIQNIKQQTIVLQESESNDDDLDIIL